MLKSEPITKLHSFLKLHTLQSVGFISFHGEYKAYTSFLSCQWLTFSGHQSSHIAVLPFSLLSFILLNLQLLHILLKWPVLFFRLPIYTLCWQAFFSLLAFLFQSNRLVSLSGNCDDSCVRQCCSAELSWEQLDLWTVVFLRSVSTVC